MALFNLSRQRYSPLPPNEESEDALVEAARRGDRRAFDALVRACEPPLRRFLAGRVAEGAVDDLLQETWLAAWVALPRFNRRARFRTWLYGIALHKCADHHRARGRSSVETVSDPRLDAVRSPEDLYAAAELRETVQSLLRRLPAAQREVVELYYYAELTLPEIAGLLARNLNTVKYQFYRAHAQVAQALEGDVPVPGGGIPAGRPITPR